MKAGQFAIFAVAAMFAGGFAASCSTSRKAVPSSVHKQPAVSHPPVKAGPKATHKVADALVAEARTWIGVPYVSGGKSRLGADCSGLLMAVYRDAAGIQLPRTTGEQWLRCAPVDRDKAAIGDIIFFSSRNSGGKIAHVGMYVGNGRMIHASSSRGVVEDDLSLKYYVDHYVGTGRVPQIADATPAIEDAVKHVPEIIAPPVPELPPVAVSAPVRPTVAATVHADSLPQLFARAQRERDAEVSRGTDPVIITVVDDAVTESPNSMTTLTVTEPVKTLDVSEPVKTIKIIEPVAASTDSVAKPAENPTTVVTNAFSKFK